MQNILLLLAIYFSFYLLFTFLGIGITQIAFRSRTYLIGLMSPIVGLSLFCLVSTALMQHMIGSQAGHLGLLLASLINIVLVLFSLRELKSTLFAITRYQWLGILSGLIFLLPLLITNDIGIFAINGADFGSYAGWGKYFQDYSLRDTKPLVEPFNYTLKAFVNLQHELTRPGGMWRVGNVSLFTAINSLLPLQWPTVYMVTIAFLIAQFTIAIGLFARVALFQSMGKSFQLGFLSIFLTTIIWLASSHYVPNIIGLDYTLFLISLYLLVNRLNLRAIFVRK